MGQSVSTSHTVMELEGRSVQRHFIDEATGKPKLYKGKAHFLGQEAAPYCFKITYSDGDTETMTKEEIEEVLMPVSKTSQPKKPVAEKKAKEVQLRVVPKIEKARKVAA